MYSKEMDEFMTQTGIDTLPEKWQNAIKNIYSSYPSKCIPMGICDPVYICNTIALALGLGDGQSNFYNYEVKS